MALGILKLVYLACIIIGVMLVALLVWKPVIFKKPQNFLLVQLFPVIISFIIMTSLPSNYILARIIASLPIVLSIIGMLLQKKNYKWANIITIVNVLLSVLLFNIM